MSQYREIQSLPIKATAALTACRLVSHTGGLPADGGNALGAAKNSAAIGEMCAVITLGTAVLEASAAIAKGAAVESGADGRIETQSAGVTIGRAFQAAGAAGDKIEVILIQN